MEPASSDSPIPTAVRLGDQPWSVADDHAVAREMVSPRNSRATRLSIADIRIPPGVAVRPHRHEVIEEVYHVVSGTGWMTVAGKGLRIAPGDSVVILPGERHDVVNDGAEDLRLVVTCTPPWTPECLVFD